MPALDKKSIYPILLIEKNMEEAELMTEWLQELGQVTHVIEGNNLVDLLKRQHWNLIIVDMDLNEVKKQGILKIIMDFAAPFFILILTSKDINESIADEDIPYNLVIIYKPLDKNLFFDAIFNRTDSFLNRRLRIDRRKHRQRIVLFIGAHPDDVEIGSSGCIAKHYQQGDSVNILTLSSGEAGGDLTTRREESKKSAEMLHANLFIKELIDTKISHVDTIRLIDEVVQQLSPSHVYTHSIHDAHQDHRNVHHASVVACRSVPNLYCYLSPSTTIHFKPTLFVEITNYIDKKLMALAIYQSQASKRPYLKEDMVRATARYWGRYANYCLVEPMEIIRQTESQGDQKYILGREE